MSSELTEKTQQALDNAVLVMNQQFNAIIRTFVKNVNVALEQNNLRKQITYHDVFVDFKLSLEDLVEAALEIDPKCISIHRNTKDKNKAKIRHILSYIAGQMGYSDQQIAAYIGSDRSTVTIARHRIEEALIYNDVATRKLYNTFLEKLRKHPNSEILDSVIHP